MVAGQLLCDGDGALGFSQIITDSIIPLTAFAGVITSIIVALSYMFGEMIQNQKIIVWAKTEFFQIFISLASALLIVGLINSFCTFNFSDIVALTQDKTIISPTLAHQNIYDAAKTYLEDVAKYSHDVLRGQRAMLARFNMLEGRARWYCLSYTFCLFNPSGYHTAPYAGVALASAAFTVSFNTSLFSYLSSLNYLFILNYTYSGIALLFIPFGIFLRSMPYMRSFGGLILAVVFSFLFIYPSLLAIFNIIGSVITQSSCPTDEGIIEALGKNVMQEEGNNEESTVPCNYANTIMDSSGAFIFAVFLPTIALVATIASIRYVARLLGEDIDLSRVVQMM